jgi:hypothetical protein
MELGPTDARMSEVLRSRIPILPEDPFFNDSDPLKNASKIEGINIWPVPPFRPIFRL